MTRTAKLLTLLLTSAIFITVGLACGDSSSNGVPVDSGSLPDAASSDVAAADGGGPPVSAGPLDPAKAARAAVIISSCYGEFEPESSLYQMYSRRHAAGDLSDYRGFVECIDSKHNGCQAVADCIGIVRDFSGPCADRCDGNTLEACDDSVKVRVDCTKLGRTCKLTTSNGARCVRADALDCPDASLSACGDDGRPKYCQYEQVTDGVECSKYGLTCAAGHCVGNEGACQAGSQSSSHVTYEGKACDGQRLKACAGGGLVTLDCGSMVAGATCQNRQADGGPSTFCGFAVECNPDDPVKAQCEGDNVTVCNGGRIDRVDCKALGFTGCQASRSYAFCIPSFKGQAWVLTDGGF